MLGQSVHTRSSLHCIGNVMTLHGFAMFEPCHHFCIVYRAQDGPRNRRVMPLHLEMTKQHFSQMLCRRELKNDVYALSYFWVVSFLKSSFRSRFYRKFGYQWDKPFWKCCPQTNTVTVLIRHWPANVSRQAACALLNYIVSDQFLQWPVFSMCLRFKTWPLYFE